MVVAMIFPDGGGRGGKDPATRMKAESAFKDTLLKRARAVLKWAPELAQGVLLAQPRSIPPTATQRGGRRF